jgi:hypothetical protein
MEARGKSAKKGEGRKFQIQTAPTVPISVNKLAATKRKWAGRRTIGQRLDIERKSPVKIDGAFTKLKRFRSS